MKYFDSSDDQARLDLRHGDQLAACRQLAKRQPPKHDAFCWEAAPAVARAWPGRSTAAARADALDAADLQTCYSKG